MNLVATHAITLVVALLSLASCRGNVVASDYAKACAADDECVVVEVGDTCDPNRCEAGAIHVDELERYRASQGDLCWQTVVGLALTTCGSSLPADGECVDGLSAACVAGTCTALDDG